MLHAVKKCIRKEQRLALKPWVTKSINESISVTETVQENNQAKEWSDKKEKTWDLQNLQK